MTKVDNINITQHACIKDLCYVYAKTKYMRHFKAFDLDGHFVGNLIYASLLNNDSETQQKLQQLADHNKEAEWQFQLRKPSTGYVLYETKLVA